jgi:hypothetical protein
MSQQLLGLDPDDGGRTRYTRVMSYSHPRPEDQATQVGAAVSEEWPRSYDRHDGTEELFAEHEGDSTP